MSVEMLRCQDCGEVIDPADLRGRPEYVDDLYPRKPESYSFHCPVCGGEELEDYIWYNIEGPLNHKPESIQQVQVLASYWMEDEHLVIYNAGEGNFAVLLEDWEKAEAMSKTPDWYSVWCAETPERGNECLAQRVWDDLGVRLSMAGCCDYYDIVKGKE